MFNSLKGLQFLIEEITNAGRYNYPQFIVDETHLRDIKTHLKKCKCKNKSDCTNFLLSKINEYFHNNKIDLEELGRQRYSFEKYLRFLENDIDN